MATAVHAVRIYVETSVFGGACDPEFERPTRTFFEQAREGRFRVVASALVEDELEAAPSDVRSFAEDALEMAEIVAVSPEALWLRGAYVGAGIVGERHRSDALHVALATVARCATIVSWNFRHIVHSQKIPFYNAVNAARGYPGIAIYTPQVVIVYEDQGL